MRQSTYLQYDKIGRYTQKIITIFSCLALLCTAGSLFCLNSRQNRVVYFHINSLNIRCFLLMSHRWESDINATECFSMWVVQKEVKRRQDSTKQCLVDYDHHVHGHSPCFTLSLCSLLSFSLSVRHSSGMYFLFYFDSLLVRVLCI